MAFFYLTVKTFPLGSGGSQIRPAGASPPLAGWEGHSTPEGIPSSRGETLSNLGDNEVGEDGDLTTLRLAGRQSQPKVTTAGQ